MKDMIRLVYVSTINPPLTQETLASILEVSVANNERDGITGVLAYNDMYFWQLLDGPSKQVNQLYQRLIQDSRHREVTLKYCDNIDTSPFSTWSMQLLEIPALISNEVVRTYGKFDPYEITSQHALEIMEMLRDRAMTCA